MAKKKARKASKRTPKPVITMGAIPLSEHLKKKATSGGVRPVTRAVTHVAIVLDRSSSMSNIRTETIQAFNDQVRTIQAQAVDQDISVSLVTFSDYVDNPLIWDAPASALTPLSVESYNPNGWTALYDAVGTTIARLNNLPDANDPNTAFLMVIISDGEENRSQQYQANMLSSYIRLAQATKRWTFAYVGANQDLSKVQETLHIPMGNIRSFVASGAGVQGMAFANNVGFDSYFLSRSMGNTASANFYDQNSSGQGGTNSGVTTTTQDPTQQTIQGQPVAGSLEDVLLKQQKTGSN